MPALDQHFPQLKPRLAMVDTLPTFSNLAKVFTPTRLAVDMEVLEEPVTRQVDRVTKTANMEVTKLSVATTEAMATASNAVDGAATTDTNWPHL